MEDKDTIIYLALGNQLNAYNELLLEGENLSEEELSLIEYIISRTEQILQEYEDKIKQVDNSIIPRPKWDSTIDP